VGEDAFGLTKFLARSILRLLLALVLLFDFFVCLVAQVKQRAIEDQLDDHY
jgi:hypothetical protein